MTAHGRSPPHPEGVGRPLLSFAQLTFHQLEQYTAVVHHIDQNLRLPTPSRKELYEFLVLWMNDWEKFASRRRAPRH